MFVILVEEREALGEVRHIHPQRHLPLALDRLAPSSTTSRANEERAKHSRRTRDANCCLIARLRMTTQSAVTCSTSITSRATLKRGVPAIDCPALSVTWHRCQDTASTSSWNEFLISPRPSTTYVSNELDSLERTALISARPFSL